jgi:hypothetical protein
MALSLRMPATSGRWGPACRVKGTADNTMPFDEEKLQLVREFLQREFRSCVCRDYFDFDRNAQVFVMEAPRVRQTLVVPSATFENPDFARLLNWRFVTVLAVADGVPVTLTSEGPR